jgi:hypothetical protein
MFTTENTENTEKTFYKTSRAGFYPAALSGAVFAKSKGSCTADTESTEKKLTAKVRRPQRIFIPPHSLDT